jgi:Ca-activated chloride channel homolog
MTLRKRTLRAPGRTGAITPLMAILLPVALILGGFAINIAMIELNRTEMYISADAASRAAGRDFALTSSRDIAMESAREAARRNTVGGAPLLLADSDFVFGQAFRNQEAERYEFNPGGAFPNAVEVSVKRTKTSGNGAIAMPFGSIFSNTKVEASQTSRSNQIEVDIAMVVDCSGSMAYAADEPAVYPPFPKKAPPGWDFGKEAPSECRWRDAVNSIEVFIDELDKSPMKELVSLSTYSDSAGIDQPLTSDYKKIRQSLNERTNKFNAGATNISGGINEGRRSLAANSARDYAAKIMVVLTDGIDTTGSNPVLSAEEAAKQKIMIFTVTFSNEADQKTMGQVAQKGMGKHYHATNASDLRNIFRDIARQLPILITR